MVFKGLVAADWAHTNISGFPHLSSKLYINRDELRNIRKDIQIAAAENDKKDSEYDSEDELDELLTEVKKSELHLL